MRTVVWGLLIPFIGTAAGAACVFFLRKELKAGLHRALTGFAAGVMVAASIWSLIVPAIEQSAAKGRWAFSPAFIGFWLGILFLLLLDHVIPHLHRRTDQADQTEGEGTGDEQSQADQSEGEVVGDDQSKADQSEGEVVGDDQSQVDQSEGENTENDQPQDQTEDEEPEEESVEKVIFVISEDGKTLKEYNGEDEEVTVPEGIEKIGKNAFFENKTIKKVTLPDSVTTINSYAFAECSNLEKIILGEESKLKTIGMYAFQNDAKLDISFVTDEMSVVENAFEGILSTEEAEIEETSEEGSTAEETEEVIIDSALSETLEFSKDLSPKTEVADGEQVVLEVGVNNEGVSYTWQWSPDGEEWYNNSSTTNKLSFTMASKFSGRKYRCTVSKAGYDSITSVVTTLSFPSDGETLEFSKDLSPKTEVADGEQVLLEVGVNNEGVSYTWQWSPDGAEWYNNSSTTNKLSFTMAPKFSGRMYRCTVSKAGCDPIISVVTTLSLQTKTFVVELVTYEILDDGTSVFVKGYAGTANSVTIPEHPINPDNTDAVYTVTKIGESAFEGNTSLQSIALPNSVTDIGKRAFANCSNLSTMTTHDD